MKLRFFVLLLVSFPLALRAEADKEAPKDEAAPSVEVVVVKARMFSPETTALGVIATPPAATLAVTFPAEIKITGLLVHPGQSVKAGEVLLTTETPLELDLARNAAVTTARALDSARKRFDLKLITLEDMVAVEQTAGEARLKLDYLLKSGISSDGRQVLAPVDGTIESIPSGPGDLVAASAPLAEMIVTESVEARAGWPVDAAAEAGQDAEVTTLNRKTPVTVGGKVQSVSRTVGAETHLLELVAALPDAAGLHPGEAVKITVAGPERKALLVPKAALRMEEGETLVFTVEDGKAKKHTVEVGEEEGDEVEILGDEIKDGDAVVTVGNSQLADGMAVEMDAEKDKPDAEVKP